VDIKNLILVINREKYSISLKKSKEKKEGENLQAWSGFTFPLI
jgi:hypothetical protein